MEVDVVMKLAEEKGWNIDRSAAEKVVRWAGKEKALKIIRDRPYRLAEGVFPSHVSYPKYLESSHWKHTRRQALERRDYRCDLCNDSETLEVHHKTYERLWQELPSDLTVLCEACHTKFHDWKKILTYHSNTEGG